MSDQDYRGEGRRNDRRDDRRGGFSGDRQGGRGGRSGGFSGPRDGGERPDNWRPGRSQSDPARLVVFDVLMQVEVNDAYANLVLPKEIRRAHLGKQDAAFATNLAYGTLRMQGRWDAILAHGTNGRPIAELDPPVRVLLRMGAHQILAMSTPEWAAINEMVKIARNEVGTGASGFVNAALRRVSEKSLAEWQQVLKENAKGKTNSPKFLGQWFSHPEWIVLALDRSLKANGRTHRDLLSVLKSDNTPAKVALVAREIEPHALMEDARRGHMDADEGALVDSAVVIAGGDPHRVFAVQDGLAGVQDEGSQLIARTFAAAPIEGKDELWLDMCAGPGGKTATLAAMAGLRGARIHANEPHEHRLDLVADSVGPWSDIVDLRLGDGRTLGAEEAGKYDRILVDAPCTGIGALRRRPESRWRKQAGDALDLAKLQGELLDSGWDALREGGILMYSTCSPYLAETHDVVAAFRERHPEARVLDTPAIASTQAKTELTGVDGMLQLWPDLNESDAMFMVILAK